MCDSNSLNSKRPSEVQSEEIEQAPKVPRIDSDEEKFNSLVPVAEELSQTPVVKEELDEKIIEDKLLNNVDSGEDSESVLLDEAVLLEETKEEDTVKEANGVLLNDSKELLPEKSQLQNGHAKDVLLDDTHSKQYVRNEDVAEIEIERSPDVTAAEITNALVSIPEESPRLPTRATYEQDYFQSFSAYEIARCSWDRVAKQNYVRGCLWSPDGTCVLAAVQNDGMHVFELPSDMYEAQNVSSQRPVHLLDSAVHVRETTMVYDYKWYPGMHSSIPGTSVWIASRQHEPIQMWDAFTGELRCSYKGYNAVDEVEAALSLTWSMDGEQIFGGYKKSIKLFDVKAPGREISSFPTKVTASCMTVCSPLPNLLIFGSWSRSITALVTNANQTIPVGNNSRECSHNAGVTWLKFIPRTNLFVSGGRKDHKLMMWDIRNLLKPYHVLYRTCDTNQRVYFDSSPYGEWIVTGNTNGALRAWNLLEVEKRSKSYRQYNFPLHRDCCNGVSFHPSKPILATSSGQFNISLTDCLDISTTESESTNKAHEPENSLTLWWIGKTDISEQ